MKNSSVKLNSYMKGISVVLLLISVFSFGFFSSVKVSADDDLVNTENNITNNITVGSEEINSSPKITSNQYCADGNTLTYLEYKSASDKGVIYHDFNVDVPSGKAVISITNNTGCILPVSLSSYKMFDQKLSSQEYFDGTGLIEVGASADLEVDIPNCMAQIDFWYGLAPENLLDSNPYSYPNSPIVLDWRFAQNNGSGFENASGNFCVKDTEPLSCSFDLVSDSNTKIDGVSAVETYNGHPDWTASIPGANWIWKTFFVENPEQGETVSFERGFYMHDSVISASLEVYVDDKYDLYVNGEQIDVQFREDKFKAGNGDNYDISSYLKIGENKIRFVVTNIAMENGNAEINPAGLLYKLSVVQSGSNCDTTIINDDNNDNGGDNGNNGTGNNGSGDNNNNDSIPAPQCLMPDSLGDIAKINIGSSSTVEKTLQQIFTDAGFTNSASNDQKQYQKWNLEKTSTTIEVQFVDQGAGTGHGNTFGYYVNGDITTFVPLFRTNNNYNPNYINVPVFSKGQKIVFNVSDKSDIEFAIVSQSENSLDTFSTELLKNSDGKDHVIAYNAKNTSGYIANSYLLAFEDIKLLGDADYNDVVVLVKVNSCGEKDEDEPKQCIPFSIENFDINQTLVSNASLSFMSPNSLGDELDIVHSELVSQTKLNRIIIAGNKLYANYDSSSYGITTLVWDGVDNSTSNINKNGLNNFDLTEGGTKDSFGFTYYSDFVDNKDVKVVLTVYSGNNSSSLTTSLYNVAGTWHEGKIKFSDFVVTSGTGADFTKVGAIEMKIDTTSRFGHDFGIGNFRTLCKEDAPVNTPPTITLVGANPIEIIVGSQFTDPGATANDLEDGDLTSSIVKTGTVNTAVLGTYTLTYTVTDSQGLSANTTREVVVKPVSPEPKDPTVSLDSNPSTIDRGGSSTLTWNSQNADSCSATWTTSTAISGSASVSPESTTDYVISCVGNSKTVYATSTVIVNISSNPPTDNGGGGGGGIGGRRHDITNLLSTGEILGATSCSYLRDYLKIDWTNDRLEVLKLQSFLNVFEGENLQLTGVYDQATFDAVVRFQTKYSKDILEPWGERVTTGFVYILTKKKVNEIYCNTIIPLSQSDANEIDSFRNNSSYQTASGAVGYVEKSSESSVNPIFGGTKNEVLAGIINDKNMGTSEEEIVVNLENEKVDSVVKNLAVSIFSMPSKVFGNCRYSSILLFLILVALIIIIVKMFTDSKGKNDDLISNTDSLESIDQIPPVVILPGMTEKEEKISDVSPPDEIVIDNGEEVEGEIK